MMSATRRIQGVPKPPSHDSGLGVGVGAGVFYTVISCHEEIKRLNKTVEQMEYFIQEMRQQLQHHHENLLSLSCSGSQSVHSVEIETVSSQGSKNNVGQRIQPFGLTRSIDPELCIEDQTSTRQVMSRGRSVESCRMAALEAELEAELELMELNMNAVETFPDQSMTTSKEVQTSYFSDASPHGLLETSNLGRHSTHLEEAPTDYAVSPIELDLRLRQILEAQQQERVLELELLLKETEAKLLAKDQELLCWKHHVHSLTNGFQPLSACGTDMLSFNNASGTNSAPSSDNVVDAVPQATKSTLELFQSFQDPPISMELNNVGSANGSVLSENIFKKQRNLSNFSVNLCSNNRSFLNEASDSSSPLDFVNVVTESNTCWHVQGTGIDTPESIIMEEIDVHTPVQVKSEIFRGQSVSRTSETSDCTLHDEWSSDMLPLCHSPCDHPDSFLVNVGTKDTPPSRVKVFPSESNPSPNSHHMKRKPKTTTSLSSDPFRSKDAVEGDCSDVKHIVDSFKLKPDFLHVRNPGPAQEPVQAPRRILNLNSESLQIVTRGLRRSLTLQESSMEVKSPVLDKIRHWEVLAGHIGSKTSS